MSTPGFGLVPSGCPTMVFRGLRPVNVAFTLLIFILVFYNLHLYTVLLSQEIFSLPECKSSRNKGLNKLQFEIGLNKSNTLKSIYELKL
jgi:hypothetical protein